MEETYESLRDQALRKLKSYMDSLEESKGKKLAYWVSDYARFLNKEQTFVPQKNVRYKRGSVVKAHLGFRIGSEEGGLHYAIVIDSENQLSSPIVTVVPLTSIKDSTDLSKLHHSKLSLGSEIYDLLSKKANMEIDSINEDLDDLRNKFNAVATGEENAYSRSLLNKELKRLRKRLNHCNDVADEIKKMKNGSIALVGQITTISKIRIYDPQRPKDPLSGLRVSDNTLNHLDDVICNLYTGENK